MFDNFLVNWTRHNQRLHFQKQKKKKKNDVFLFWNRFCLFVVFWFDDKSRQTSFSVLECETSKWSKRSNLAKIRKEKSLFSLIACRHSRSILSRESHVEYYFLCFFFLFLLLYSLSCIYVWRTSDFFFYFFFYIKRMEKRS